MLRSALAFCLFSIALVGCKTDPECDRMRMSLSKAYGSLRESAVKRKLAGVDAEGWTQVEDKAALLESSFMTSQVTWDSAEKAKADLRAKLSGRQTDSEGNLRGYQLSAENAFKEHDAFRAKCR